MLELSEVTKYFSRGTRDQVTALDAVSIRLEAGDFVMVIGSNGAGKSSLLNAVAGVYPIDHGRIWLDGKEITRQPEHLRARSIGRVFQNPALGTAPSMTLIENLAMAAIRGRRPSCWRGVTRRLKAQLAEALSALELGLDGRLSQPVALLSGGERQAVALLMATLTEPKLLLLDEHYASLDPKMALKVLTLTAQFIERHCLTTLMVTHNIGDALKYGSRLLMMHRGQVVFAAAGQEKANLTVEDVVLRFGQSNLSDRVLLSPSTSTGL